MKIRFYEVSDLDQAVALWFACGLTNVASDPRNDIERKLVVNPELFLLGEVEGLVVVSVMAA